MHAPALCHVAFALESLGIGSQRNRGSYLYRHEAPCHSFASRRCRTMHFGFSLFAVVLLSIFYCRRRVQAHRRRRVSHLFLQRSNALRAMSNLVQHHNSRRKMGHGFERAFVLVALLLMRVCIIAQCRDRSSRRKELTSFVDLTDTGRKASMLTSTPNTKPATMGSGPIGADLPRRQRIAIDGALSVSL